MKPLESSVERRFVGLLDSYGLMHLKLNVQGNRAYPDRIVWLPEGRPVLVELKRPGEKPRPLQEYQIKKLRELGYSVIVEDNADRAFLLVLQYGGFSR